MSDASSYPGYWIGWGDRVPPEEATLSSSGTTAESAIGSGLQPVPDGLRAYSPLNAAIGSIRAAREAGTNPAAAAVTSSVTVTVTSTTGSRGDIS